MRFNLVFFGLLNTQYLSVVIRFYFFIDQEYSSGMIIRKAYKFRISQDKGQQDRLISLFSRCRFLWNKILNLNLDRLENKKPFIWFHEADLRTKTWKKSDEYSFLKALPAHCMQQKLKELTKAFRYGFDKKQLLKESLGLNIKAWVREPLRESNLVST